MDIMTIGIYAAVAVVAILVISSMVIITPGKTAKILETFGKPHDKARMSGLSFKLPWPITGVVGEVNLRQTEKEGTVQVRANDNAFVTLPVTVQMKALGTETGAVKAFYELNEGDPRKQIMSYVLKEVKDTASGLSSEEMYSNRSKIKEEVIGALGDSVRGFGYELVDILVDEPKLSEAMQDAFEEVKSSEMLKKAAENKAAAKRIELVGIAEAEKESQRLKGEGIANMRKAIANGIKEATDTIVAAKYSPADALALIMDTNRLDTISAAAKDGNLILMDVSSGSAGNGMANMIAANKATGHSGVASAPSTSSEASEAAQ